MQAARDFPKIIWTLWLQGWEAAPEVAQASLASWRGRNPGWRVVPLDRDDLAHYLPDEVIAPILGSSAPPEAISDRIRLELLHLYGGVWVDATTICARPLDDWLPDRMGSGFFAFKKPAPDRPLASWFLAAEKGSYLAEHWCRAVRAYWQGRVERDHYFWLHNLFAALLHKDPSFEQFWQTVPDLPAAHSFHFGPANTRLSAQPTQADLNDLRDPSAPVFKLTYRHPKLCGPDSLMDLICRYGRQVPVTAGPPKRRILVAWYGSFKQFGTIGDLLSLQAVVSHLVGCGHEVLHATGAEIEIAGASRVDWETVDLRGIDGAIFVCGPILKTHPTTGALFARLATLPFSGIGVSLMPEGHMNHLQPFDRAFARQGGAEPFGDVAITGPQAVATPPPDRPKRPVIGLALRGRQPEYGLDICLWRETADLAQKIIDAVTADGGSVITIDNHLVHSGKTPDEIEASYSQCDLVVTSRFHGAVTALRHDVPFIAIDQIKGGAKVYDLLAPLGWRHVYRIDEAEDEILVRAALALIEKPDRVRLLAARQSAVAEANRTLAHLDRWIGSLEQAGWSQTT